MVWLKLVICILIIFFSGQKVARYGDIIAERTGLGRFWMGLIAVALITSLPELFTGISAVTIVNSPDLAIGDLVGANAFNMAIIAVLIGYSSYKFIIRNFGNRDSNRFLGAFLGGWFGIVIAGAAVAIEIGYSPSFPYGVAITIPVRFWSSRIFGGCWLK